MDESACNYNSTATCDDGSCVYPGCTDPLADNYDETAACEDGSCAIGGVYNIGLVDQITTCGGYVVDNGGSNGNWILDGENHSITIMLSLIHI